MTDKKLLELAAKAAGIELHYMTEYVQGVPERFIAGWNPLTDDGDALLLAVKLNINVEWRDDSVLVGIEGYPMTYSREYFVENNNIYESMRRAIVRAAAEIGKNLTKNN